MIPTPTGNKPNNLLTNLVEYGKRCINSAVAVHKMVHEPGKFCEAEWQKQPAGTKKHEFMAKCGEACRAHQVIFDAMQRFA